MEARSHNHWYHGKVIRVTYSECIFTALGNQHAKHMLVLYCHMRQVRLDNILPYYLIKGKISKKKDIELQMRVLFSVQFLSETFLIL